MGRADGTTWSEGGSRAKVGVGTRPRPRPGEPLGIFAPCPSFGQTASAGGLPCSSNARPGGSRLLQGALFAKGRRTGTRWRRAAGVGAGFAAYYYFLATPGHGAGLVAGLVLQHARFHLAPDGPRVFALDAPPTKRYGKHVQGAGVHHHPTPGPTEQQFLYGHVGGCLAWLVPPPLWGATGRPLRALLYVRHKDVPRLPQRQRWSFRTKLVLAAELLTWAADRARSTGRVVRAVVDGCYAKRPFLKAAAQAGGTALSRWRRDAGRRTLPVAPRGGRRRRGRPPAYGAGRISLAKRAGQKRGWQVAPAQPYGAVRDKRIKPFLATGEPAGGCIRGVLVQEERGRLALFSTDGTRSAAALRSGAAGRFRIEQDFHDLKEVEGLGQQQVRDRWANGGAFHVNAWAQTLIALWAWRQPNEVRCDRSASPWDAPERRPSQADRRKALQRQCLRQESLPLAEGPGLTPESQQFVGGVINHAA